jgi:hypothetical protein
MRLPKQVGLCLGCWAAFATKRGFLNHVQKCKLYRVRLDKLSRQHDVSLSKLRKKDK